MVTKETKEVVPLLGGAAEAWEAHVRYEDTSFLFRRAGNLKEAERLRRLAAHYQAEMVTLRRRPKLECEARRTAAFAHVPVRTSRILEG